MPPMRRRLRRLPGGLRRLRDLPGRLSWMLDMDVRLERLERMLWAVEAQLAD